MQDSYQREQALDTSHSYIVQAPAGSGKTELLTNRYLSLLSQARKPENVLALTFTNKAVSELRSRIIHSLLTARRGIPPTQPHKLINFNLAQKVLKRSEEMGWNIVFHHSRIQISTFDGLAYKIAQHAHSQEDLRTTTLLEYTEGIYEESMRRVLKNLADNEAKDSIVYVLKHFQNNTTMLISLVSSMLKTRSRWIHKLYDPSLNKETIKKNITRLIEKELEILQELFKHDIHPEFLALTHINPTLDRDNYFATIEDVRALADLCLTKTGTVRKKLTKNDGFTNTTSKENKEFITYLNVFSEEFIVRLQRSRILPKEVDLELTEHISKVLLAGYYELLQLFDEEGGVDYEQITSIANKALAEEDDIANIALYLDANIEHILIDEFQDTSFSQLELIQHIVEHWQPDDGRTLFCVGDPMQSIYLFRGAQVEVFLSARDKGIAGKELESIVLSSNFRSSKDIVEHNNKVCAIIFPNIDRYNEGQVSYTPSTHQINTVAKVEMHPFTKGNEHMELDNIATLITDIHSKNPEYTIAILGRTATQFATISAFLQNRKIAISTYENIKFTSEPLVKDLLNICAVLLDKYNKLAWLSILRSPYVGVELSTLLLFSDTDDVYSALLRHKEQVVQLQAVYKIFSYAFRYRDAVGFSSICAEVFHALNIVKTLDYRKRQIFDEFVTTLDTLELTNNLSLTSLKENLNKKYTPSTPSKVNLMTIHKAKGLEFDVVILPHLNAGTRSEDSQLLYINEFVDIGVLIGVEDEGNIYEFLKENYKLRIEYERMRLLYVALTRAKKELYMSACLDMSKNNPITKGSFLGLLSDSYADLWKGLSNALTSDEQKTITHYKYNADITPLLPSIPKAEHITSIEFTEHIRFAIGSIVHKLLELEKFQPSYEQIAKLCKAHNLPAYNTKEYVTQIQHILTTVTTSKHFDFIFQYRLETKRECSLIYNKNIYIIDRIFNADNCTYIIDFKTVFEGALSESALNKYTKQLHNYVNAVKSIYNNQLDNKHIAKKETIHASIKAALFIITTGELIYV